MRLLPVPRKKWHWLAATLAFVLIVGTIGVVVVRAPWLVQSIDDLPLVELPVTPQSDVVAIFYSGDGGWRDLDRDLAAILQADGMAVVGVDVMSYYWKKRGPDESAADLARIMRGYRQKWNASRIALIGFSFGANILPALYNRLPEQERKFVSQISLLGFSPQADFEVTVGGWLGGFSPDAEPTLPEIARVPPGLVQCFYGEEDDTAACGKLEGSGIEIIRTTGGHHFDGDYQALAHRILDGEKQRSIRQAMP